MARHADDVSLPTTTLHSTPLDEGHLRQRVGVRGAGCRWDGGDARLCGSSRDGGSAERPSTHHPHPHPTPPPSHTTWDQSSELPFRHTHSVVPYQLVLHMQTAIRDVICTYTNLCGSVQRPATTTPTPTPTTTPFHHTLPPRIDPPRIHMMLATRLDTRADESRASGPFPPFLTPANTHTHTHTWCSLSTTHIMVTTSRLKAAMIDFKMRVAA